MATKSMAYDHSTYVNVATTCHPCAAGANAVSVNKFVAFTAMILKSATATVITAGTSVAAGNGVIVKAITAAGVTTSTLGTLTLGSNTAGVSTNLAFTANNTLAQGEQITFTNGTDATGVSVVALEFVLVPGASLTA